MVWVVFSGIVWFSSLLLLAVRWTRRHQPPFPEPPPSVEWAAFSGHRIRTSDGEELGAWLDVTPDRCGPFIVITHGNGGSRTVALHVAKYAAECGCRSLLISHRAHGDSSGRKNDFGYSARLDIVAAVRFLEQYGPQETIIVWGRSLGSAAAIFAAPEFEGRVAGLIIECPYKDLHTAIRHRAQLKLPPLISHVAFYSLRVVAPLVLPHIRQVSPEQRAALVPQSIPVLVLCGGRDRRARPFEAEAVHRALGDRSQLVQFPEGDHMKLHLAAPQAYDTSVRGFIERVQASRRQLRAECQVQ